MELKVSEEFVREAHREACCLWKTKIEKEFPELFKNDFKVGKWYYNEKYGTVIYLTELIDGNTFNGYGFNAAKKWFSAEDSGSIYAESCHRLATHEEVESALITEAKKRGYKGGVRIKGLGDGDICPLPNGELEYINNANALWFRNPNDDCEGFDVFKKGVWATILPEEKTIITKEKALKIIAKKLKVSPESIEIK